ncbi:hypothetical protein TSAR_009999, partial [Trichomalopsis sarcophagae]
MRRKNQYILNRLTHNVKRLSTAVQIVPLHNIVKNLMADYEEENSICAFILVAFVQSGKKRETESVDIIPSQWLRYNPKKERCVTPFMKSPIE